jgi:hypothetical protein
MNNEQLIQQLVAEVTRLSKMVDRLYSVTDFPNEVEGAIKTKIFSPAQTPNYTRVIELDGEFITFLDFPDAWIELNTPQGRLKLGGYK